MSAIRSTRLKLTAFLAVFALAGASTVAVADEQVSDGDFVVAEEQQLLDDDVFTAEETPSADVELEQTVVESTQAADEDAPDTEALDAESPDSDSFEEPESELELAATNVVPDTNLRSCINETLNRATNQAVTAKDLQGVTTIKCYSRGVVSLQGLQYATNLGDLDLSGNRLSDISPLGKLTKLERLDLALNQVSNVSALGKLKNLSSLDLSHNQLSDVSPLVKLTKLEDLYLWDNRVSNVSPLGKMTWLKRLELGGNQISDISPLVKLKNLWRLDLSLNRVSNWSPLGKMTWVQHFSLIDSHLSDVSALGKMTGLTWLDLSYNQIVDVSPLVKLKNLSSLDLSHNQLSDVSPLAKLTTLKYLELSHNRLSDAGMLRRLVDEKGNRLNLYVNGNYLLDWRAFTPKESKLNALEAEGQRGSVKALVSGGKTTYDVSHLYSFKNAEISWRVGTLEPMTKDIAGIFDCEFYKPQAGQGQCFVTDWKRTDALSSDVKKKTVTINEDMSRMPGVVLYGSWEPKPERKRNARQYGWFVLEPVYSVRVSSVKVSGASKVAVGKSVVLKATVGPSNASNKALSWKSSNTAVATVDANGKVTTKKPGTVTITATAKDGSKKSGSLKISVLKQSFRDVPISHPFYSDVEWLAAKKITTGWPDKTFRPSEPVTRAAFAAFLYRMAGSPKYTVPVKSTFKDVPTTHQFYKEISWAASKGITKGWSDGTFRPEAKIQRAAIAAFLYRFAGQPKFTVTKTFKDVAGSEHRKAIEWLASKGISTGWSDGTFRPTQPTERGAIAAFLHRYSTKKIPIAVK